MTYSERNTWAQLASTVVVLAVYIPIVVGLASSGAPTGWTWLAPMLVVIGLGILLSIIGSIVWNIAAGIRRGIDTATDERDRHISHIADRVGQAFLVIAALIAIVLCAMQVAPFWIAQVLFAGFAVSALVGGVTSVILYRAGTI